MSTWCLCAVNAPGKMHAFAMIGVPGCAGGGMICSMLPADNGTLSQTEDNADYQLNRFVYPRTPGACIAQQLFASPHSS